MRQAYDGTPIAPPRIQRAVGWGMLLGISAAVGLLALFEEWLLVPAVAPSVLILPPMATAFLGVRFAGFRLRWRYGRELRKLIAAGPADGTAYRSALTIPRATVPALDGVEMFCTDCWHKLDNGEVTLRCPACDAPMGVPAFPDEKRGVQLVLHATGKAFLWSTALTVAGYGVMWVIAMVFM